MQRQAGGVGRLLTDVVMPDLSGPELAIQLRSLYPALKMLFITGCADDPLSGHGESVNPSRVLGKPFQGDTLVRRVRESLRR